MQAITVVPGEPGSAELSEVPDPRPGPGDLLVETIALGVCGTDREIVAGEHGEAPPGGDRLVLGHELLGRVREAPPGSGVELGDLVAGIVSGPIPSPVPAAPAVSGTCAGTGATPSAASRAWTATAPSWSPWKATSP